MASNETSELFDRLLGNPHINVTSAISTFVQEFETKRTTCASGSDDNLLANLRQVPEPLKEAKNDLDASLHSTCSKATSTAVRLQQLQQSVSASNQRAALFNPTLAAKQAFQKDIDEAKEAFDQEMTLRHADVIKQYVGTFVQQIDHY